MDHNLWLPINLNSRILEKPGTDERSFAFEFEQCLKEILPRDLYY